MGVMFVLVASILLQFAAALLALRLIRISGRRTAWVLIAIAVSLMAIRRSITFIRLVATGDWSHPPDLTAEVVALAISTLMVIGIARIAPLFHSLRRSEETLRKSEKRYRRLVESSQGLIYTHDLDGVLLSLNPAAAQALGRRPHESIGKNLRELISPSMQHLFDAYLERIRQGQTDSGLMRVAAKKNKERIWVYRNVRVEETGDQPYVLGHAQDITDRVRAEEALQRSEANLKAIFNSSPQSILLIDRHHTIQAFNHMASERVQTILGKDLQVGDSVYTLIPQGAIEAFNQHFDAALQGEPVSVTKQFPVPDNADHWIEAQYYPVFTADEHVRGVCLSITNVTDRVRAETERKSLEDQLRQTQKMEAIGVLAGGIAHDFNNILSALIGYTELALLDIPQHSRPWQNLQEVLTACMRAKRLVQQILAFSRQTEQERKPVQFHVVVKEAMTLLRASLPSTIDVRLNINAEAGTILADPTQMHQVLMNLCTNAEHAMRETGGVLEVCVDPVEIDEAFAVSHPEVSPGPHVRLTVRDTGTGIAPEVQEHMFEPFFTTKEVGEGTGMGLSTVHGIVIGHGGTITAQSTIGEGTTFAIYLPRIDVGTSGTTHEEAPPPHGTECILFVDDEPSLAQMGQEILEYLGYRVATRTSSIEALEAFRVAPQRFDLVITDQTMPNMTGEILVRELRQIRADIPIILCTGFSHVTNATQAQAMGIDAYLMKPITIRDMAMTIRQVLEPGTAHDVHRHSRPSGGTAL